MMAMGEHCEPAEFTMSGHTPLYPISDGQRLARDLKEERNFRGKTTPGHSHLLVLGSRVACVRILRWDTLHL